MCQEMDMTVNRLPAPTWNWLHMNEVRLHGVSASAEGVLEAEKPDEIEDYRKDEPVLAKITPGMGEDMDGLAGQCPAQMRVFKNQPGNRKQDALRLHFSYRDGDAVQNRVGVWAQENSELTVIADYRREGQEQIFAASAMRIRAEKGALVHLVQIQKLGTEDTFLNDVGISCGAGARVETVQLVLDDARTCVGLRAELSEQGSSFDGHIGYLLDGPANLDVNYIAYHSGAKTMSDMDVSGVLRGQAQKLFRGTIDFRLGSVGAKGNEKEDVLLFSDGVINRTIPLILCEEEDVEGNHGATIGRLDEALLFYLTSRGMDEEAAREMMARARIDAICRHIPDEKAVELVQSYIGA